MFEGFFGKLLIRIVNYLLRQKISFARWDEHEEKLTRPTSDFLRPENAIGKKHSCCLIERVFMCLCVKAGIFTDN